MAKRHDRTRWDKRDRKRNRAVKMKVDGMSVRVVWQVIQKKAQAANDINLSLGLGDDLSNPLT